MRLALTPINAAILGGARVGGASSLDAQIAAIYAAGRLGPWFDVSDLSTMYTTRAGMTPVGTPGDGTAHFVGRMEDKSQGRVLGAELVTNGTFDSNVSGWTGQFDGVPAWVAGSMRVTNGAANSGRAVAAIATVPGRSYQFVGLVAAGGTGVNASISVSNSANGAGAYALSTLGPGSKELLFVATATTTYVVASVGGLASGAFTEFDNISVRELPGYHALAANDTTARPQLSARVNLFLATATLSTQSVTTVATNYTLAFSGAGSITLSGTATGTYSAGSHTVTCTAGTLTATVSGAVTNADIRPANIHAAGSIPAYQRVTSAEDYDSVGFPYRLIPNGTGQALQTSTITPGTDSVTVGVGVRKTSDASQQIVLEHTASVAANNGSWYVSAPDGASTTLAFTSKGTALADAVSSSLTAPVTRVMVGTGVISTDTCALRLNGAASSTNAADQGSGNYSAAVTNLFARGIGGTPTLWFGGQYFGSLEIYGSQLTAGELATVEAWINSKTKAY